MCWLRGWVVERFLVRGGCRVHEQGCGGRIILLYITGEGKLSCSNWEYWTMRVVVAGSVSVSVCDTVRVFFTRPSALRLIVAVVVN